MSLIEIGPGTGILTQYLLDREMRSFTAMDIDEESVTYLKQTYPEHADKFVLQDYLKAGPDNFGHPPWHIIGNFPYNISSQIFFRILEQRRHVAFVAGMVQKEVAERIASPPGSKVYGILSVLLQAYFDIDLEFNVKPGAFFPPPKVNSSVITLTRNNREHLDCDEELFLRIVKTTFQQRRKTIRNTLKTFLLNLSAGNELLSKRPEQLSVKDFEVLTRWVESESGKINKLTQS